MTPPNPAAEAPPQLLVSVRSAAEALAALAGGCDVLDIKEPAHGPLGRASLETIFEICRVAELDGTPRRLSVAWGEAADGPDSGLLAQLPMCVDFVKAGVAGLSLTSAREQLREFHDTGARGPFRRLCVLACYADHEPAGSPSPEELFSLARDLGLAGLLVDTWDKRGPGLFATLGESRLRQLVELARQLRLPLALAGRLTHADLPELRRLAPEIVGIRSAACLHNDRQGSISADRVRTFRNGLQFAETPAPFGGQACTAGHGAGIST